MKIMDLENTQQSIEQTQTKIDKRVLQNQEYLKDKIKVNSFNKKYFSLILSFILSIPAIFYGLSFISGTEHMHLMILFGYINTIGLISSVYLLVKSKNKSDKNISIFCTILFLSFLISDLLKFFH